MRILRLAAQNFKRLTAVELELDPEGGLVVITGKNGAGKTCTMDIVSACLGGKKLCPEKPIREGEKYAEIEVETEEWTVTRRFVEGGTTTLKVVKADGCIVPKGQTFLDMVVGRIGFDPMAFVNEDDAKKQRKTLLDLVGVDLTELDEKIKALREQRTAVGRTLKQAEAEVEASESYPDAPDEEISAGNLAKELGIANAVNQSIQDSIANMSNRQKEIIDLKQRIVALEEMVETEHQFLIDHQPIDDATLTEKVSAAEETNRQVRANAEGEKRGAHHLEVHGKYLELSSQIAGREDARVTKLANADMPVEGLSVSEDGVTFNGIPIAQIAASEQIKVGLAVSMALNPELRVLLIRDGSLLDADNLKLIDEMTKDQNFQCLIERVEDGSEVGFIIEDGQLKE